MPEFKIKRLGHHGDGIGDGIFAPLTLPGEVITGEIAKDRISAPKIITPSPDRVSPPCPHFKRCGGCALQHASDGFVETWKAGVVTEALRAQGLEAPIRGVSTSPANSRRRATFSGRRTKSGVLVGFNGRGSDVIYDIPNCTLLRPELIAALPVMEDLVRFGASRKGVMDLAVTLSEAGLDVAVTGGKPLEPAQLPEAVAIAQTHKLARLSWDGELVAELHAPLQRFDGIAVAPPSGAFLQATSEGEAALRVAVLQIVGKAPKIVDLFAGCGTFALPLARGAEVHAVEGQAAMLSALDQAWRGAQGLKRVSTEVRDLFRRPVHAQELRFDAAVIDPPRAGAEAQVHQLAASQIPTIAMVSCNPVTFARDAKTLTQAGFALNSVEVVDQFRWSPHIELVGCFTR